MKHAIVGGGLPDRLLAWRDTLSGLGVGLYHANDGPGDPVRVSFLDPRPDAKRVNADANQVCWNKAELRRAKGN